MSVKTLMMQKLLDTIKQGMETVSPTVIDYMRQNSPSLIKLEEEEEIPIQKNNIQNPEPANLEVFNKEDVYNQLTNNLIQQENQLPIQEHSKFFETEEDLALLQNLIDSYTPETTNEQTDLTRISSNEMEDFLNTTQETKNFLRTTREEDVLNQFFKDTERKQYEQQSRLAAIGLAFQPNNPFFISKFNEAENFKRGLSEEQLYKDAIVLSQAKENLRQTHFSANKQQVESKYAEQKALLNLESSQTAIEYTNKQMQQMEQAGIPWDIKTENALNKIIQNTFSNISNSIGSGKINYDIQTGTIKATQGVLKPYEVETILDQLIYSMSYPNDEIQNDPKKLEAFRRGLGTLGMGVVNYILPVNTKNETKLEGTIGQYFGNIATRMHNMESKDENKFNVPTDIETVRFIKLPKPNKEGESLYQIRLKRRTPNTNEIVLDAKTGSFVRKTFESILTQ